MNKTELVAKTQENLEINVSKKDLTAILEGFTKTIVDEVAAGEKVAITGFGSFESVERAAREGRNPLTGEDIHIPASKSPKFKASKTFKDVVKNA